MKSFRQDEIAKALLQAAQLGQSGQLTAAAALCRQILQKHPNLAPAWHLLGLTALQQGQAVTALEHIEKAIAFDPTAADFHNHAGVVQFQLGNLDAGIACYQKALLLQPQSIDACFNLALGLQKLGNLNEAIAAYSQLIDQQPHHAQSHYQLGNIYQLQGQYTEAIGHYQQAVAINPNYTEAWYNLGVAQQELQETDLAFMAYQQTIKIDPNYAEAYNALGTVYEKKMQATPAIKHYQKAVTLQPNLPAARLNLANALLRLEQFDAAEVAYQEVLGLDAENLSALDGLVKLRSQTCNWQELSTLISRLEVGLQQQSTQISPHNVLFLPFPAPKQQEIAQQTAQECLEKVAEQRDRLSFNFSIAQRKSKSRCRLGYVSGDFRYHAVAHLMVGLFELHDRSQFQVFAYSLGPDDGSNYRRKLEADCDCFRDMSNQTSITIAQQIYDDGIDILIDLAGYTDYGCPQAFALCPAPIQVNYLGYPGTLGADYIDYIIVDDAIAPPHLAQYFTEKCIYLPYSYQINNDRQPIPTNTEQMGEQLSIAAFRQQNCLPEHAFVFCCFNHCRKFEPVMFGVWMCILRQVPNSVLWLLAVNPIAEQNLRNSAQAQSIDPERLIFAPPLSKAKHLNRLQCADLFLDTLHYNAHTTGSDALWAGVPVITLMGETFAARVGASLLMAVGLPELITNSLEDYERLAIHLATTPDELNRYKLKLIQERSQLPLFNTAQTVKHLETAYRTIWQNYCEGRAPDVVKVSPEHGVIDYTKQADANLFQPQDRIHHPLKTATNSQPPPSGEIICRADEGFATWLEQAGGSIVISTYQAGKLLLVGWHNQKISILMRQFDKPMGIAVQGNRLALATKHEVILFANARPLAYSFLEEQAGRYDALFLPRVSYLTGDLFIHDLGFGGEELWFVNTRFSCLATLSSEYNFVPRWQPPFITELVPEDRCHLNGMAMIGSKPKYVTALGIGDTVGGWRATKATGGVVMDVDMGEVILQGLSMPHSPVWYNNFLWLLNSGTGELWRFDPGRDRHEVICSLPVYGRGLCIVTCASVDEKAELAGERKRVRTYALVGLSQIREQHIFGGLPIQSRLEQLICGVAVVDLDTGIQVGLLSFEIGCQELYGISFLKGISRPSILNQDKSEIRDAFTSPEFSYWLRPSALIQDDRGR